MSLVSFVSLGPGDPELITVKTLGILRNADVVLVPATKSAFIDVDAKDGAQYGNIASRAAGIISYWNLEAKVKTFLLPMMGDGRQAMSIYDDMCNEIYRLYMKNRRVVVAVEGDMSIYASIHYVQDRLVSMGVPVEQVPGVTSFIAAAALAKISLASHKERLMVVPGDVTEDKMMELVNENVALVIMKLSKCEHDVKAFMSKHPECKYYYFENLGSESETFSTNCMFILNRPFPYFSIMIVKR